RSRGRRVRRGMINGVAPASPCAPFKRAELRAEARVVGQRDAPTREPGQQIRVEIRLWPIRWLVRDPVAAKRLARPLAGIAVPRDAPDLVGVEQRRGLGHHLGRVAWRPTFLDDVDHHGILLLPVPTAVRDRESEAIRASAAWINERRVDNVRLWRERATARDRTSVDHLARDEGFEVSPKLGP